MKKYVLEFVRRGLMAGGFGPLVLAVIYLVQQHTVGMQTLTVNEVCLGIFSLYALAFVAGSLNLLYQIERLPLMGAILIHGIALYVIYLATYLLNGWLRKGIFPLFVFTIIFVIGYLIIWIIIYFDSKRNTENINKKLRQKQEGFH